MPQNWCGISLSHAEQKYEVWNFYLFKHVLVHLSKPLLNGNCFTIYDIEFPTKKLPSNYKNYSIRGHWSWITFLFRNFDAFSAMSIVLNFLTQKEKQIQFSDFFSIEGQCYVGGGLLKDTFLKINFLLFSSVSILQLNKPP